MRKIHNNTELPFDGGLLWKLSKTLNDINLQNVQRRNGHYSPISHLPFLKENGGSGELCTLVRKKMAPLWEGRQAPGQGTETGKQSVGWSQPNLPPWPATLVQWTIWTTIPRLSAGVLELSCNLVLFDVEQFEYMSRTKTALKHLLSYWPSCSRCSDGTTTLQCESKMHLDLNLFEAMPVSTQPEWSRHLQLIDHEVK